MRKRLNERSRSDPYSSRMRGLCPDGAGQSLTESGIKKAAESTFESSCTSTIDRFAVFLDKAADGRRQKV